MARIVQGNDPAALANGGPLVMRYSMAHAPVASLPLGIPGGTRPRPSRLSGTRWDRSALVRGFYALLERFATRIGRWGLSADAVTMLSLVVAVGAGVVVALGRPGWAAALVLASGGLDLLDGAVARGTGTSTRWGALLDSTLDRVADAAPLIGLAVFYSDQYWAMVLPLVALVNGFLISYIRSRAENLGAKLPELPMRRAERVLLLATSLILGALVTSAWMPAPLMLAGIALFAVFSTTGVVVAMGAARRVLSLPALEGQPARGN